MGIADELITRGWTQHTYEAEDGSVCLYGAAARAYGVPAAKLHCGESLPWVGDAIEKAVDDATDNEFLNSAGSYNDHPHRTFDEVLRVAKMADEILDGMTP